MTSHPASPHHLDLRTCPGERQLERTQAKKPHYLSTSGLHQPQDGHYYSVFSLEKEEEKKSFESHAFSIFKKQNKQTKTPMPLLSFVPANLAPAGLLGSGAEVTGTTPETAQRRTMSPAGPAAGQGCPVPQPHAGWQREQEIVMQTRSGLQAEALM